MNESIKQLRYAQSREFNTFCDKILAHNRSYPKSVIRKLQYYRQLFTAILENDKFRDMASDNLRRLQEIECYIEQQNLKRN